MKKLTIVLDIDGVIFDTPVDAVNRANNVHGTNFHVSDIFNHHAEHDKSKFVIDGEDQFYVHQHAVNDYSLVPGCREALTELQDEATFIALTSRNYDAFYEDTKLALEKYLHGLISELFFTTAPGRSTHDETKGEIIKRIGGSVLIDDAVKHCESARAEGIDAILFGQPYNQAGHAYPSEWRAADWPDATRIIRSSLE
jgi:beta-phosphoglucomutase-like phosphatase (HAD superfamily)